MGGAGDRDAAPADQRGRLHVVFALRDETARAARDDGGWPARKRIDHLADRVITMAVAARVQLLEDHALTDVLTGLGNRRALERDLAVEVARARRSGLPLTVAVIDVNGLKVVNDRRGHDAGDDALRAVAGALQGLVRRSDRAYRQGGDEFALLLGDSVVIDPATIAVRLERAGAPSCGIGLASSSLDDLDDLLAIADQRMYASRRFDRGRGEVFDAAG